MLTLIKFAVRNVLRNKRRTLLTASSILIATFIVTFGFGFFTGFIEGVERNELNYFTGNYKVTTQDYVKYERFVPTQYYIPGSAELASLIRQNKNAADVEERIRFGTALGIGEKTEPAMGVGIDLGSKKFDLQKKLIDGKLEAEGLYVCDGLASKLRIKTGDAVLIVSSTSEGGLNGIKLNVKGIVHFNVSPINKRTIFIDLANARKLLKMKDGATEIVVFTDKKANLSTVGKDIAGLLPVGTVSRDPGQQTDGFYNLMHKMLMMFYVFLILVLLLASFVIVNTMVMSVYERMKEIGTLKALGMTDRDIFSTFTIEGVIIGLIGGLIGSLIGYGLTLYTSVKGLDVSAGVKNRELPMDMIIYPSADVQLLFAAILLAVLVSAVTASIPARRAQKMSPVDALRQL